MTEMMKKICKIWKEEVGLKGDVCGNKYCK